MEINVSQQQGASMFLAVHKALAEAVASFE